MLTWITHQKFLRHRLWKADYRFRNQAALQVVGVMNMTSKKQSLFFPQFRKEQTSKIRKRCFKAKIKKSSKPACLLDFMAEMVGFEPTCRFIAGNSISSRARYDLFDTSPCISNPQIFALIFRFKCDWERTAGENTIFYSIFKFEKPCK